MALFDRSAAQRATRTLRRNRMVRAVGLPAYRAKARLHGGSPPRVFANSIPKSGTHLVTALLDALPDMRYSGHHLTAYDFADNGRIDWVAIRRRLASVRDGQYVSAHLIAAPELCELLVELGYRSLIVIRDPRDAAVSDLHYIEGFRQHPLHRALTALPEQERLAAVVSGMPGRRRGIALLESMAQRLDDYRGWMDAPATRTVRFEALVGSRGGGSDDLQITEIRGIGAHVGRPLTEQRAREIAGVVWSPKSSTFREGRIGGWQRAFTEREKALVKQLAGGQIIALGYEKDNDW